jgi:uncharacterized pyridoxamine 5'-phosphate oxidase family protein
MEKIYNFLDKCGVFYFATVDGDEPRVRPFGFKMLYKGELYFGCGTQKATYRELEKNPNVEICCFADGAFLRIRGKAVMEMGEDIQKAMYEAMPHLKEMYNEENGLVHCTFRLEDMSAVYTKMGEGEEKWA